LQPLILLLQNYINIKMIALPDIEKVSAEVHNAWIESKKANGVTSRLSEDGEELMVDYELLSEKAKDLDRNTVKAVYAAIMKAHL
jgi:hypothetical protein